MSQPPPRPLTWSRTWKRCLHKSQIKHLQNVLQMTLAGMMRENLPINPADLDLDPRLYQVELILRITPLPPESLTPPQEAPSEVAP